MSIYNNSNLNFNHEIYKQQTFENSNDPYLLNDKKSVTQKKKLDALRHKIISAPRGERKIDKKQLALMHGDTFICESNLAGGNPTLTLTYWKNLLTDWRKGNSFIKNILTSEDLNALLLDMEDAITAHTLITNKERDKILSLIKDQLIKRKRFVIPLQYVSNDSGHGFTAVFELDGDNMKCQLLNRGEGIGCHPIVEIKDGKIKRSYCSDVLEIPFNEFSTPTDAGKKFWDFLILYATTVAPNGTPEYCSEELYSLFFVLADKLIPIDENSSLGATPQRGGSCSEKVPELLIRQYIERRTDNPREALRQRKKVLFAARFDSLLDAYHDLDLKADEQNHFVLKNSLNTFLKLVDDLRKRNFITDEEIHLAVALAKQIDIKIKHYEKEINIPLDLPHFDQVFPIKFAINEDLDALHKPQEDTKIDSLPLLSASPKISEKFDPSKIKEILKEWVSFATETEKKDRERAFLFVYLAIHSLPIPKNEEDIWDLVPETDILESLRHLKTLHVIFVEYVQLKIIHAHLRTLTKNALALFDIMTTYSAFAIVHKLCSRLKDLKLKGYGIGTPKILHHFDKNPGFFYSLGEDVIRFSEIQSYFNQINSENGKLFLIPNFVSNVPNGERTRSCDPINLKNYLNHSLFRKTSELLCASFNDHIKYLLQFTEKKNDANTLANFWANKVAEEYSILEHFAGLAQFVRNQPCHTHTVVHKNNGMIHFAWTTDTFDDYDYDYNYDYNEVVSPAVKSRSFVKPLSQNENDISITESGSHNDLWRNQSDYQEFLTHLTQNI